MRVKGIKMESCIIDDAQKTSSELDEYDFIFLMEHLRNRFLSVAKDKGLTKHADDKQFATNSLQCAMHMQSALDCFLSD